MPRKRTPLAPGNRYTFNGYPSGFCVRWFTFSRLDGLPGVAITWFGRGRGNNFHGFYPYKSERAFWRSLLFRNAVDAPPTGDTNDI
jgi:hypothetical protein